MVTMQTKWLFVLVMVVFALAVSGCTDSSDGEEIEADEENGVEDTVTYEEDGVKFESTV